MPRKTSPEDYALDFDRGGTIGRGKQAQVLDLTEADHRAAERHSAASMDLQILRDRGPSKTQAWRDAHISRPRDTSEPVDPRLRRQLPATGSLREPVSARQRKERSKTKRAWEDGLPEAQDTAVRQMITRRQDKHWDRVNDALSANEGDVQLLDDLDKHRAQRVDRAIQDYERRNDREHVLYANVRLPNFINNSNRTAFIDNNLAVGDRIVFDRYTMAAHCLHEVEPEPGEERRTVYVEVKTRRGIYLGRSDAVDDTAHLYPRGTAGRIVGIDHQASFRRPDGSTGRATVIQLIDDSTQR